MRSWIAQAFSPWMPNTDIEIRTEQARLLKQRALGAFLIVELSALGIGLILWIAIGAFQAALWSASLTVLVAASYLYSRISCKAGITIQNSDRYLIGHTVLFSIIGIWMGAFYIYLIDFDDNINIFVTCVLAVRSTVGGVLLGASFRPAYLILSFFTSIPFGIYVATTAPYPINWVGYGIITYFFGATILSNRASLDTREANTALENRRLNERIIEQNQQIQKISDEKAQFLAATSHDLSQPLYAQGYFINALSTKLETEDQKALLTRIQSSWDVLSKLLQGLSDINQLDSGMISVRSETFDLKKEVTEIVRGFSQDSAEKNITISTHLAPDIPTIFTRTDPALLARILRNIIANAITYSPSGSEVHVAIKPTQNDIKIEITDNGPGISTEDQTRIFDEYVRLDDDTDKQMSNVGLGLSIVKRLVDLLDLKIELLSAPGEGSTFILSLKPAKDDQIPSMYSSSHKDDPYSFMPLIAVLAAEDENRKVISNQLSNMGCQLMAASTPDAALDMVIGAANSPVLLIIDEDHLAYGSAEEFIAKVREETALDIPAILLSSDEQLDEDRALNDTATQHMPKPLKSQKLKEILDQIMLDHIRPST